MLQNTPSDRGSWRLQVGALRVAICHRPKIQVCVCRDPEAPLLSRSPSRECSPTKIDYRKKGTLILTSLLEDLAMNAANPAAVGRCFFPLSRIRVIDPGRTIHRRSVVGLRLIRANAQKGQLNRLCSPFHFAHVIQTYVHICIYSMAVPLLGWWSFSWFPCATKDTPYLALGSMNLSHLSNLSDGSHGTPEICASGKRLLAVHRPLE